MLGHPFRMSVIDWMGRKTIGEYNLWKIKTDMTYRRNKLQWDAVASPYKKLHVTTENVKKRYTPTPASRKNKIEANGPLGEIISGDWDSGKTIEPIRGYWIVKGLKERFNEGKSWSETEYVGNARAILKEKQKLYGCETVEEFIQHRCSYVDNLYRSIKKYGFSVDEHSQRYKLHKKDQHLPPLVLIDRDGSIVVRHGIHRFAIAEVLGIKLPVYVRGRHAEWQRIREYLLDNGKNKSHPDLLDL